MKSVGIQAAMSPERALRYAEQQRPRFLRELVSFVRFPSVGVLPEHRQDLHACANWLAGHLRAIGLQAVALIRTPRHPLVYAEWFGAPGRPVLLIYGHYDVQPVDPVSEWKSPPFDAVIRRQDLYGRGASDDKGQLFVHLKALESILRASGRLPLNVRCMFEGEEESGSDSLQAFILSQGERLAADVALVSDSSMPAPGRPALTMSLRGTLSLEVQVNGLEHDLHSGLFGGAVINPLQVLSELLAGLHDRVGRITLPGFYARVHDWSTTQRAKLAQSGPTDVEFLRMAGARLAWGEPGYSLYERATIRPSISIHGIQGGYQGPGPKAVIPARAKALLSVRLAPNQEPDEIEAMLRAYIKDNAPAQVVCSVRRLAAAHPVLIDEHHPAQRAALHALSKGFNEHPLLRLVGGTIPIVSTFQRELGMPVVLMGFGLPDDRPHAPNEKFHLPNFFRGIQTSIHFFHLLPAYLRTHIRAEPAGVFQ